MRERFAGLLNRTGALGAMMRLRRYAPVPTLSIVTFHHVWDPDPDYPFDPGTVDATPGQFRRQIETLARYCTPIGIDELIQAIDGAPLPKNPVMVTFDDGYQSCHEVALPILRAVGVRATFFISTSFITERRLYWWERIALILRSAKFPATITYPAKLAIEHNNSELLDRLFQLVKTTPALDVDRFLDELGAALGVEWNREIEAEYANGLIMSWDQVRSLARAGMDVESHGRRHRVLGTLDDVQLADELSGSRTELEAQLGRPVRAVAYPVGRRIAHQARIREAIAAAGYRVGMSNRTGVNAFWPPSLRGLMPIDPFDVRRLATDRRMSEAMFFMQVAVPSFAYIDKD